MDSLERLDWYGSLVVQPILGALIGYFLADGEWTAGLPALVLLIIGIARLTRRVARFNRTEPLTHL